MSGESLPSGVLNVADLLIEARIEGDSRYTLRTSAVAFAKGAEFALNIARRYLASPHPQAAGALSEQKIDAIVLLAEKMMRDSWATGADSAWHPARDDLRAALSSAKREAEPLTDAKVIAMNPYLNDEGRRALWLAAFRMAEKHHGITAASQVEPEDKHG